MHTPGRQREALPANPKTDLRVAKPQKTTKTLHQDPGFGGVSLYFCVHLSAFLLLLGSYIFFFFLFLLLSNLFRQQQRHRRRRHTGACVSTLTVTVAHHYLSSHQHPTHAQPHAHAHVRHWR